MRLTQGCETHRVDRAALANLRGFRNMAPRFLCWVVGAQCFRRRIVLRIIVPGVDTDETLLDTVPDGKHLDLEQ